MYTTLQAQFNQTKSRKTKKNPDRRIEVLHSCATLFLFNQEEEWSGKRDSNSRPQPWQGCALPAELFPPALQAGVLYWRRLYCQASEQ